MKVMTNRLKTHTPEMGTLELVTEECFEKDVWLWRSLSSISCELQVGQLFGTTQLPVWPFDSVCDWLG